MNSQEMMRDLKILLDLLNPLHGAIDRQVMDQSGDNDPPDDREFDVNVTARQERDLTQAICILESRLAAVPVHGPYMVECQSGLPFYETIAAFDCMSAARGYLEDCQKINPSFSYRLNCVGKSDGGAPVERMRIDSAWNVSIGKSDAE